MSAGWVGATAKQEGLVALSDCVIAIGDDNDFGVGGTPQSQLNIVRLPKCLTELYQARFSWAGLGRKAANCMASLRFESHVEFHGLPCMTAMPWPVAHYPKQAGRGSGSSSDSDSSNSTAAAQHQPHNVTIVWNHAPMHCRPCTPTHSQ